MRKPVGIDVYLQKIKPLLRKTRFSQLKIDEIAKAMDISKVTLYKHFSSKDEIIEQVTDYYIDYLQSSDTVVGDDSLSYAERFRHTFAQSLIGVLYVSDLFLEDLKAYYPHHYERLAAAQQSRSKNLQSFFEAGMERQAFNPLNAQLFIVQDDAVLRRFLEPSFSIQYDVTLKQAILDFYRMKQYQLLAPAYLHEALEDPEGQSALESKIAQILQNFS
ncbi:TetR/AcrR family transcriptional regulator [Cohnella rhizosphaerae]|uniref:TetR/AcrR family transcriptional regulator n=1 Tax=Cohnella rhizosphaerae TaxID=1457232 RepID=A0A9X4QUK3_9BACL|nr:TetR/AcrR family transcriptional regulator [Cohnella rhizosphaerae]MDG0810567.1 TetR/AcrR family transcriptional regulator [Cohnella rhizosphaerae]